MDVQDKVLGIVRMRGPLIPAQVSKELSLDLLMSSALLAALVSKNQVKVSSLKVGGSPLYYVAGQEYKLQNYADKLHEKERRTFELLRAERVLEDKGLDTLNRFALRQIKDFAKPIEVTANDGESRLFWKWYLLRDEETEQLIRAKYFPEKVLPITAEAPAEKPEPPLKAQLEKPVILKPVVLKSRRHVSRQEEVDAFRNKIASFFKGNAIEVLEQKAVKRDTETDYLVLVPSAVGKLKYYCRVRKKPKISETDLGAAFAQGQLRNLPVLYITNGELTKKAKESLQKEYISVTVKRL